MTEQLHFHFSLSCTGEGNGNPLRCSCLENPRDGEAWWAAVYQVAQSRTRLKRLSSRSSQNRSASASSALLVGAQTWFTLILNGLPWKRTEIILSFLRLHPSTAVWTLLLTLRTIPFLLRDSCPQWYIEWSSELNQSIPVHFSSLIPRMSMSILAISCQCHLHF